jgi:Transmembrane secretion effector
MPPPEEILCVEPPPTRALALLRRRDFRRVYCAVAISEIGDAFQYIALMWVALVAGGPLAYSECDSQTASRRSSLASTAASSPTGSTAGRTLVAMDLARAALLVPIAVAGLAHHLSLWALIVVALVLTTATSYFEPAYGALLPNLVERRNVQAANGLVQSTTATLSVAGWQSPPRCLHSCRSASSSR